MVYASSPISSPSPLGDCKAAMAALPWVAGGSHQAFGGDSQLLDVLLLTWLCFAFFQGFKHGLLYELSDTALVVFFLYNHRKGLAIIFDYLAFVLPGYRVKEYELGALFLLCVCYFLCTAATRGLLTKLAGWMIPPMIDQLLGGLFVPVKNIIFAVSLLLSLADTPLDYRPQVEATVLGPHIFSCYDGLVGFYQRNKSYYRKTRKKHAGLLARQAEQGQREVKATVETFREALVGPAWRGEPEGIFPHGGGRPSRPHEGPPHEVDALEEPREAPPPWEEGAQARPWVLGDEQLPPPSKLEELPSRSASKWEQLTDPLTHIASFLLILLVGCVWYAKYGQGSQPFLFLFGLLGVYMLCYLVLSTLRYIYKRFSSHPEKQQPAHKRSGKRKKTRKKPRKRPPRG